MEGYRLDRLLSLILFSSLPLVFAESHSHFFTTTITNDSMYNYAQYCTIRSLDDIILYRYDSDNQVIERRVPWFKSTSSNLLDATVSEYRFQLMQQKNFEKYRQHMNDTEGFPVMQLLDGCILYEDGTFDSIFDIRYNGNPFIRFSVEKASWIADEPRAQVFVDKYNENKTASEQTKNLLETSCVSHIAELLSLGNCTFNRKEEPIVVVRVEPITVSKSRLHCRAYGHYPKTISMMWYKSGEPLSESLSKKVILPLPDITYLTWISMDINVTDNDNFTCSVNHSSMMSPLMARISGDSFELSGGNREPNFGGIPNGGIIGICLAVVVLVVVTAFASVWWTKNRRF